MAVVSESAFVYHKYVDSVMAVDEIDRKKSGEVPNLVLVFFLNLCYNLKMTVTRGHVFSHALIKYMLQRRLKEEPRE